MSDTSDTPEESTDSIPVADPETRAPAAPTPTYASAPDYTAPQPAVVERRKSGRLNKIAALVGIVAGAVVIVAVIFWSGFVLGAHSGKHHHHHGGGGFGHDRGGSMEHRGGPPEWGPGQMTRPGPAFGFPGGPGFQGGPGGQGQFGQGQGQGPGGQGQGPSGQGPGALPPTQRVG